MTNLGWKICIHSCIIALFAGFANMSLLNITTHTKTGIETSKLPSLQSPNLMVMFKKGNVMYEKNSNFSSAFHGAFLEICNFPRWFCSYLQMFINNLTSRTTTRECFTTRYSRGFKDCCWIFPYRNKLRKLFKLTSMCVGNGWFNQQLLGGGFIFFEFISPTWGNDPI